MSKDYENYVGNTYSKLTILCEYSEKRHGKVKKYFDCVCECGKKHKALKFQVLHGNTKSCGCDRYEKEYTKVKIGDRFEALEVLTDPEKSSNGRVASFICDCGTIKSILISNVLSGSTKSCGCYTIKRLKDNPIGVIKLPRSDWKDVCARYATGETTYSIAVSKGVGHDTIERAIKLSGEQILPKVDRALRKDIVVDRSRFSDLNCRDTAYYYGLLLADGCLTGRTGNTVSLSLKLSDGYMVDSFHHWMSAPTKLTTKHSEDARTGKTYSARVSRITDHVIAGNLRSLGFEERKSTKEKLPSVYVNSSDFWRGMIDGDGHISPSGWAMNLCGSQEICEGFSDFAVTQGTNRRPKVSVTSGLYLASLTNKKDVKIVLDALYKDTSLFLDRKYNVYFERYL